MKAYSRTVTACFCVAGGILRGSPAPQAAMFRGIWDGLFRQDVYILRGLYGEIENSKMPSVEVELCGYHMGSGLRVVFRQGMARDDESR